jgi:hypothetical protein
VSGDPLAGDPAGGGDPTGGDLAGGGDPAGGGDSTGPGDPAGPGDPVAGDPGGAGCTIESVAFTSAEAACAIEFFTTMTCDSCDALFDSRICEDAINDAATCPGDGTTCTGCTDADTRADGVTCSEIELYSYFGASAAAVLLADVQANPCD